VSPDSKRECSYCDRLTPVAELEPVHFQYTVGRRKSTADAVRWWCPPCRLSLEPWAVWMFTRPVQYGPDAVWTRQPKPISPWFRTAAMAQTWHAAHLDELSMPDGMTALDAIGRVFHAEDHRDGAPCVACHRRQLTPTFAGTCPKARDGEHRLADSFHRTRPEASR
jgi:hypothetical protein